MLPLYHTQSEAFKTLSTTEWYNWMRISLRRARLLGQREQSLLSLLNNRVDHMIPGQSVGDGRSQKLDAVHYFQFFTVEGHCVHDTFVLLKSATISFVLLMVRSRLLSLHHVTRQSTSALETAPFSRVMMPQVWCRQQS